MKILHTSDWHLGKRLYDKSRLAEQEAVLDEIGEIADREAVDVIVVAGDVFDTYNPSAEAESLFYRAAVKMAAGRKLVAIAGNHDDPDRLQAPLPLAEINGVYMGRDFTGVRGDGVEGGDGWLRFTVRGERLNLALLPYPTETREKERFDSYTELVRDRLDRVTQAAFGDGFNMLVAHLFMTGGENNGTDERTLGAAVLVPPSVIPTCDYCALGHVHKPWAVSKERNIVYSGSVLNYRFGETTGKSVVLVDTADGSVRRVPLSSGYPLEQARASSAAEALGILTAAEGKYIKLIYDGAPLGAEETAALRAIPAFCDIEMIVATEETQVAGRVHLSPQELFEQFYREKKGGDPPREILDLFLSFFEE